MVLRHVLRGLIEKGLDPKIAHTKIDESGKFTDETAQPIIEKSLEEKNPEVTETLEPSPKAIEEEKVENTSTPLLLVDDVKVENDSSLIEPVEKIEISTEEIKPNPEPVEDNPDTGSLSQADKPSNLDENNNSETDIANISKRKKKNKGDGTS
jgi:hypothetical protein